MSVLAVLRPDGPVLLDATTPLLRADDLGVLRGESVFETLRVAGGRARFVAAHLQRLRRSAERVQVALPEGVEGLVEAAVAAWEDADGVLRVVATKGSDAAPGEVFALVSPVPASAARGRDGVHVVTLALGVPAGLRAEAPWLLGGVKATSYAVNMAALREAEARGAQDVLLVSSDGEVLEGPTSTLAWVSGGTLLTPPPAAVGILPGTTADVVLRLHDGPVEVRRGTVEEVRAADEAVLLGSVRGVAPVLSLDGAPLGVPAPGPVARRLAEAYEAALLEG